MSLKRTARRIFFPEKCRECGEIIPFGKDKCACGLYDIFRIGENFCSHCAVESEFCRCDCSDSVLLPHVTAPFLYSGAIKEKIHELKFYGKTEHAEFFGHEMSARFQNAFPAVVADVVTFVPMTKTDLEKRGYNQSELIANAVSGELSLNKEELLFKIKATLNQHNLSKAERLTNLDGAFAPNPAFDLSGKTVLLCDDIKTTGTTLKKCCDVLFSAGAEDVYCLCAAVTDYFVPVFQIIKNKRKDF